MTNGPAALAAYLKARSLSVDAFADLVGAHRSHIYRALSGDRTPGAWLRFRIEDATKGKVGARSWPEKRRRPLRRATA